MEIVNHRQKILDVMESSAKWNNNFALLLKRYKYRKCKRGNSIKTKLEEVRKRITLLSFPVYYLGQLV